ncbi:hypothetical protein BKA66DRAFT_568471 [Pyrenochaeta sp. MPI-SDFR-AT-0127]|nr:hypothetical protein BKA66DRAFT_568471 [Pyrenochaeta sp. MPI-SDFR-AT-0127]
MAINWQNKDANARLLAAVIASVSNKIKCTEVARLFGQGATTSTIENALTKPKQQATRLKTEAIELVKTGRVTKNQAAIATKVKTEALADDMMCLKNAPSDEDGYGLNDIQIGMDDSEDSMM